MPAHEEPRCELHVDHRVGVDEPRIGGVEARSVVPPLRNIGARGNPLAEEELVRPSRNDEPVAAVRVAIRAGDTCAAGGRQQHRLRNDPLDGRACDLVGHAPVDENGRREVRVDVRDIRVHCEEVRCVEVRLAVP